MAKATGIGGVFFKAKDPARLYAWYERHLGIQGKPGEGAIFHCPDPASGEGGMTVFSIFPSDTTYFGPGGSGFMINFRVDDLDALLEAVRAEGGPIDPRREDHDYGRFAWITDPEGNRIELWQPPPGA
jgi:predicted enzyme related to lactoylglutathione lyase